MLLGRDAECERLDTLLADVLAGRSRALVLRGGPGIGKTALLNYLSGRVAAWQVATAVGVDSESRLAFSGLHQLCAPILAYLERLPGPQRVALETVFGLNAEPVPERFLLALATLTLLVEAANEEPLICLVDDAQRLDEASVQIIGFIARRLVAERIGIVCTVRDAADDRVLAGLSELSLRGLADKDARSLLLGNIHGPLDAAVCDQIVRESRGNPGALHALLHASTPSELAGGFGLPDSRPVMSEVERSYARQLLELPADSRLLVLAAAAEPQGDPALLGIAASLLGITIEAGYPAVNAGLLTIGRRVEFTHPLARSASYRAAAAEERQRVHRALAEATGSDADADRRAWHRGRAADRPSEPVAAELEQSVGLAQARGGLAASAAFMQRAVALTVDPSRRVERALVAARAGLQVAAFEQALGFAATAEAGPLDEFQQARATLVRGLVAIASDAHSGADPPRLLLAAASQLERFDPELARATRVDALGAAILAGGLLYAVDLVDVSRVAEGIPPHEPPHPFDLLLKALATLVTSGLMAAAPGLRAAAAAFAAGGPGETHARFGSLSTLASTLLWDQQTWQPIVERQLQHALEVGALVRLPGDLTNLAVLLAWRGDFAGADSAIAEAHAVSQATGARLMANAAVLLAALQGREAEAGSLIDATIAEAGTGNRGVAVQVAQWAAAILSNGACRYEQALDAAQRASENECGLFASSWALPELIEAAVKSRHPELAREAIQRLAEVARAAGGDWALGVDARCRALLEEGAAAEELYREAIERLASTPLRPELARAHLLYGECLRRDGRRLDARRELQAAYEMFLEIGMDAFAERARRELNATGEKARRPSYATRDELTPQEELIARLAAEGFSNTEIGGRLFISARTVEWHLGKVFAKLGVGSRRQLRNALPSTRPAHGVSVGARNRAQL